MTNQELINKLTNQIEYLKKEMDLAEAKEKEVYDVFGYNNLGYGENKLFGRPYNFKDVIDSYEKTKLFVEKCTEENIDLDKKYLLLDNIYFNIWFGDNNRIRCYFYVDDDSWLYDNYFGSHSGINEWITDLIDEEYSLFSQNSSYCYAFGTHNLKDYFKFIEDNTNDTDRRVKALKALIGFVEGTSSKELHDIVVEMVEHRLNKMIEYGKKNFEDWVE